MGISFVSSWVSNVDTLEVFIYSQVSVFNHGLKKKI